MKNIFRKLIRNKEVNESKNNDIEFIFATSNLQRYRDIKFKKLLKAQRKENVIRIDKLSGDIEQIDKELAFMLPLTKVQQEVNEN